MARPRLSWWSTTSRDVTSAAAVLTPCTTPRAVVTNTTEARVMSRETDRTPSTTLPFPNYGSSIGIRRCGANGWERSARRLSALLASAVQECVGRVPRPGGAKIHRWGVTIGEHA